MRVKGAAQSKRAEGNTTKTAVPAQAKSATTAPTAKGTKTKDKTRTNSIKTGGGKKQLSDIAQTTTTGSVSPSKIVRSKKESLANLKETSVKHQRKAAPPAGTAQQRSEPVQASLIQSQISMRSINTKQRKLKASTGQKAQKTKNGDSLKVSHVETTKSSATLLTSGGPLLPLQTQVKSPMLKKYTETKVMPRPKLPVVNGGEYTTPSKAEIQVLASNQVVDESAMATRQRSQASEVAGNPMYTSQTVQHNSAKYNLLTGVPCLRADVSPTSAIRTNSSKGQDHNPKLMKLLTTLKSPKFVGRPIIESQDADNTSVERPSSHEKVFKNFVELYTRQIKEVQSGILQDMDTSLTPNSGSSDKVLNFVNRPHGASKYLKNATSSMVCSPTQANMMLQQISVMPLSPPVHQHASKLSILDQQSLKLRQRDIVDRQTSKNSDKGATSETRPDQAAVKPNLHDQFSFRRQLESPKNGKSNGTSPQLTPLNRQASRQDQSRTDVAHSGAESVDRRPPGSLAATLSDLATYNLPRNMSLKALVTSKGDSRLSKGALELSQIEFKQELTRNQDHSLSQGNLQSIARSRQQSRPGEKRLSNQTHSGGLRSNIRAAGGQGQNLAALVLNRSQHNSIERHLSNNQNDSQVNETSQVVYSAIEDKPIVQSRA